MWGSFKKKTLNNNSNNFWCNERQKFFCLIDWWFANFIFKVGQEIEVRPGIVSKDNEGKLTCKPIFSRIVSLFAEQNDLQYAVPGGLIGKAGICLNEIWWNFDFFSCMEYTFITCQQ